MYRENGIDPRKPRPRRGRGVHPLDVRPFAVDRARAAGRCRHHASPHRAAIIALPTNEAATACRFHSSIPVEVGQVSYHRTPDGLALVTGPRDA